MGSKEVRRLCNKELTEHRDVVFVISASCQGNSELDSCPGDQLSWRGILLFSGFSQ